MKAEDMLVVKTKEGLPAFLHVAQITHIVVVDAATTKVFLTGGESLVIQRGYKSLFQDLTKTTLLEM